MSKYLLRLIQQALILTFISFLILSGPVDEYPHSCADYNFGAVHAAKAGLKNVYMCPQKSGVVCNESFPIKDFSSISQSHLKWKDVILSVLVGDGSSTDAFFWWISFINEEMDPAGPTHFYPFAPLKFVFISFFALLLYMRSRYDIFDFTLSA